MGVENIKRIFVVLLSVLMITSFVPDEVFAEDTIIIMSEDVPVENHNAVVDFYDELLANTCGFIPGDSPNAFIILEYDHSDYTYDHKTITTYNVGPTVNSTFLFSLAKGQTQQRTITKTWHGEINFNSNNIGNIIKKAINLGLGLTASGSYTHTTTTTETYSGPDTNSNYSHRDFYTGTNFDRTSVCVRRRDYYNYVNQNTGGIVSSFYETHYDTYTGIDVPKGITYSIDGN